MVLDTQHAIGDAGLNASGVQMAAAPGLLAIPQQINSSVQTEDTCFAVGRSLNTSCFHSRRPRETSVILSQKMRCED